ncbi:hypothetical protein EDD85DRAFT_968089 [Armillaria nabsnona]|nr:hypothetical protein EDD85DRAFT_968089 [Armillaria nabsnona]
MYSETHADLYRPQTNSLIATFIGQDAGFVQVNPPLGTLPPLVLIPTASSPFDGWHFLPEVYSDPSHDYQSQTFEGYSHVSLRAERPRQSPTYGLNFLADSIRGIEDTLTTLLQLVFQDTFSPPGNYSLIIAQLYRPFLSLLPVLYRLLIWMRRQANGDNIYGGKLQGIEWQIHR